MSKYFYGLISNAQDLKELHDRATLEGKLEIGLSRGRILYAWDVDRNTIRSINQEEAAARLGLTVNHIDQIIATNAEVVFDAPAAVEVTDIKAELEVPTPSIGEVEKAATFQEKSVLEPQPVQQVEVEVPAEAAVAEPVDELPTVEEINAPVDVQEAPAPQPEPAPQAEEAKDLEAPLTELVDDIIAALEKFKVNIS